MYLDAAKFAVRRGEDQPSRSRLLYEVFYAYFLPQFEGIDDEQAVALYHSMAELLDDAERAEARRTIGEVLGTALAGLSRDVRRRAGHAASRSCSTGWPGPTTRSGSPPRCSGCPHARRRASSSARCSPPATRPRTCSHAMPTIVRSMAIATTDRPERCVGEIRGPVLWGETMSARSASAGDPGLFVCATTTKAYDTDENRVLKAALAAVHRAGRHAEHGMDGYTDDVVKRARHNGQHAGRLLEHQTLAQVPVVRPTGRALRRTRAGSRRHTYRPALALLRRAGEPMQADHLSAFADERTTRPARPAGRHAAAPRGRHRHQPGAAQRPRRAGRRARSRTTTPAGAATPATSTGSPSATCSSTCPTRSTATRPRPGPASRRGPARAARCWRRARRDVEEAVALGLG